MNEKLITVGKATLATVMATSVTMSSLSSVPVFAEEQIHPSEVEETKEVIENTAEPVEESTPEVVEDTAEVVEEHRAQTFSSVKTTSVPSDPNNVTANAVVTTDSNETADLIGSKLIDGSGDSDSRWSSGLGLGAHWAQIELKEVYTISSVRLFWESGKAESYTVLVSEDGQNWTTVKEDTGHPTQLVETITFDPIEAKYVKLDIESITKKDPLEVAPDWETISLYEIQVMKEPVKIDYSVLDRELARLKEYAAQYDENKIWELTKAISNAEKVRNEGQSTQEEVNKEVENLLNKEAYVKLDLYIGEVSPTRKDGYTFRNDYIKYTRASVAKLQKVILEEKLDKYQTKNVYDARREKIQKAYEALEFDKEVRGGYSGYNQEAAYAAEHSDYSGEFEINEEWISNAEGKRKIKLTVQFKNTGYDGKTDIKKSTVSIDQLSGNASDPEIGLRYGNIMLNVKPYDSTSNPFAPGISTKTCKPLPGKENYYDGFVFETMVEPGRIDVYYETREKRKIYMPTYYFTTEEAPVVNEAPTIEAKDVTIEVGSTFDPLKGVTASDAEDGDLTSKVTVEGTVDVNKAGTYELTYTVVDSQGTSVSKKVFVTVQQKQALINQAPTIEAKDVTIEVGSAFDPLKGVSASDAEDGNLTSKVTVEGTVDVNKAGTYELTYTVVDSQGASTSKTIQVTVQTKQALINQAPIIEAKDVTIVVGSAFDPLKGVTASDAEDGDLTSKISCKSNVDRNKVGVYKVTYTVMDSQGATTSKTIQVTVDKKAVTPETKPNTENKPNDKKDPEKGNGTNTSMKTNAKLFTSLGVSAVTLAGILAILKKKRK